MNIKDWKHFYKYSDEGRLGITNLLYSPYIDNFGTTLCMSFDEKDIYQSNNKNITKDLVDYFFIRECENIVLLQKYNWAAKLKDIDYHKRRIFIEWNKDTLNTLKFKNKNFEDLCPNWIAEMKAIFKDLKQERLYKLSLYPHCFFISEEYQLKTFDFYSCVSIDNPRVKISFIKGLIGEDSTERFLKASVNDEIDFSIFFENTLKVDLAKYWQKNPFPDIFSEVFV